MNGWAGSSKPIVLNTMRDCCLATIEQYLRDGGIEDDGTVVKCLMHPTNSDHRITANGGKWRGKMVPKPRG